MVGAKQFAIHRKVTPVQRINPILAAISMPSFMKSHESELYKTNAFKDKRTPLPFSLSKLIKGNPPVARPRPSKISSSYKEEEKNTNEVISDELANLITCKVLKNIKNYLNPSREATPTRHIKLEISL